MTYAEGFEDAIELCVYELNAAKDMADIKDKLQNIVDLVKKRKFQRLKILLKPR